MRRKKLNCGVPVGRRVLLGATGLVGLIAQAYAQQPAPNAATIETIVVTGYRGSLASSTKDKREATGFQDSVFAEDLGKFPDSNIAESLNRIPGIQISREITGEGLNIQIRGLGTSFTKVLLNGAPVAVASTGATDAQNTNREVDLDLLSTDLFRKLSVYKSPTAAMVEGGAAGVVDMRSARPFDNPGKYVAVNMQGARNSVAAKWGDRGSVLGSQTFDNGFGILGGVAWADTKVKVKGFETIGWTNANLSATQNTGTRNTTGGGNWTIPATVPALAGNGLTTGATIDQAFLLANNPGLTIQQIDNALIPRLGRPMIESGDKDRWTGVLSLEYRPTSALQAYVDVMVAKKKNDLERYDMNWVGRNGSMVPLNMQVDRSDCSAGCVVTKGTFANAQWFLEYRPHIEDVDLWGINPGFDWKISDKLNLDGQLNVTKSKFHRVSPTALVITPGSSGVTVNYDNSSGGIPVMATNINLNDPTQFGWAGGRVNLQEEFRDTETNGFRTNLTWGDKTLNVKGGLAYDVISRRITAKDNSGPWQAAVCGNNPAVFLPSPNSGTPGCGDASTPGVSYAATYPGFGTGYTAGRTDALTLQGSLIPKTALVNYLVPGPGGFITLNWDKFAQDSKYQTYSAAAPDVGSSNTGAGAGYVKEKSTGIYTEVNGIANPMDHQLRYNAGVRWVKTDQTVGGYATAPLADPRNAAQKLTNGGLYPNIDNFVYLNTSYNNVLPSASAALNLTKELVARGSASKTMTRANPNAMRPGVSFSSPSADVGTVGNSELKPYLSDNIDLGLELYTGREGYVGLTAFSKKINGFTVQENVTVPFSSLAVLGVTYSGFLTPTQQAAIDARGGPNVATVVMQRQKNAAGTLNIDGVELNWVQPLDKFLPVRGFGFSANATFTRQSASGEGTTGFIALGVPKKTNNVTAYYQQHGYMARLSRTFSQGSQVSNLNENGVTLAAQYVDDYTQVDFSSSFELEDILGRKGWPQLTFDIVNLNNAIQRVHFQFDNATYKQYQPNRTVVLGLRAKF